MTGLWLVSYLLLWALVVGLCLLIVGILRQIGLMQHDLKPEQLPVQPEEFIPPTPEQDGPRIGSGLPHLVAETINGYGSVTPDTLRSQGGVLLVCMSPMCESCQHLVEPLNALVQDEANAERVVVIVRADEAGCRAFLSVFPLRMPVVCDGDRTITMGLDVHNNPFGLLYSADGTLIRKGILAEPEGLRALHGDESASEKARQRVFPPPGQSGSTDLPMLAEV
jgi:hypothetical protein